MTRLQSHDISGMSSQLRAYDEELLVKTGHNLRQIACHAVELKEEGVRTAVSRIKVSIVPIRWGQRLIEGFCDVLIPGLIQPGSRSSRIFRRRFRDTP